MAPHRAVRSWQGRDNKFFNTSTNLSAFHGSYYRFCQTVHPMIQLGPEEKFLLLGSNAQRRVSIFMLFNNKRGCGKVEGWKEPSRYSPYCCFIPETTKVKHREADSLKNGHLGSPQTPIGISIRNYIPLLISKHWFKKEKTKNLTVIIISGAFGT